MIVAVPPATPVTTPVEAMVATPVAPLLHVPPGVGSVRVMFEPGQTWPMVTKAISEGSAFTVSVVVVRQPVGNV